MKPFAFIVVSAVVLAAIYAYAGPAGASVGFDLNSVQVSITPVRLPEGRSGSICGNGIGNIGYCNDIELRFRKPERHRAATAGP